jgi:glycosyltransferase involved in cell wall biosynthesis
VRILWSSVSPFVGSGYGSQTAIATKRLRAMGHDVAIFCHYGLSGSRTDWGDIPLYPNNLGDYGDKTLPAFYEDWKADLLITLVDIWVLRGMDPTLKWAPWMPVDSDPIPPLVLDAAKKCAGIVKPIAMSKFGLKQLTDAGVDAYYIPHSVNTNLFKPDPEARERGRSRYNWKDKFVIGCVATNHVERKNWNASMQAVRMFADLHPGEVIFYMHTNLTDPKGINLAAMRANLKMEDITRVPSITAMDVGIPQDIMAATYNVFDVFLLPTKGEGFGIPLIEAQATGVPIITTKCTAQTELMGGGWFIEELRPEWTAQSSWQFSCDPLEIVEKLELAYQAKKSGEMAEIAKRAREKALEYDEDAIYSTYWPSVLADIEKKIKEPKNMEGVQKWRLSFIPQSIVPRKVLDLGSGLTLPYKGALSHLGEYVAVDNRAAVDSEIINADARRLPYRDGEFGFVWCSEMLEHVEEPEKALAECKRVGRHGAVLFSTPQTPSFYIDPSHRVVDPSKIAYTQMATGDGAILW